MKIAILTNGFPPLLDGVGDYSYHLANELHENGYEVFVICHAEASIKQAVADGKFNIPVFPIVPSWNWRAIKPLISFINKESPDRLMVQYVPNSFQRWAMPVWLPVLLYIIKRQNIQIAIFFHEVYIRIVKWPIKLTIVALVQRAICYFLSFIGDTLITSIDMYANLLKLSTKKKVNVIPIPSNILPVQTMDEEIRELRQTQVTTPDEYVICTFGLRNQDTLLLVFESVLINTPNTTLLICSRLNISEDFIELYKRLKHKIVVTGFMESQCVYKYLKTGDVYLLLDFVNERGEGGTCNKSTSLAAGLAAGLPVVGTSGDMNNALLDQIPGLTLKNYGDINEIANQIITHFQNKTKYISGEDIENFYNTHLSWSVIAQLQLDLFNQ